MINLRRKAIDNVTRVLDVSVMLFAFVVSLYIHAHKEIPSDLVGFFTYKFSLINFIALFLVINGWLILFSRFGLYEYRSFANIIREWFDIIKAVTFGALLIGAVSITFGRYNVRQEVILTFWVLCCFLTILERLIFRQFVFYLRSSGRNLRYVIFVGSNARAIDLAQKIVSRKEFGYRLLGFVDDENVEMPQNAPRAKILGTIEQLPEYLENHVVDEVYIVLPIEKYYDVIRDVIRTCQDIGIICRVPSHWFEFQTHSTAAFELDNEPILTVYSGSSHQIEYLWLKRLIDIFFSLLLLTILSPLILVVAVTIKLTSKGPIFFKQSRIGYNRRKFNMIKFRTMIEGAEEMLEDIEHLNEADGPAFKIQDDPRITKVGKWLRKTSLDEVPQLVNILKGEMSLVGPRPLPIRDVEGIEKRWQKRRFSMRPGLTCLWQIGGRNHMQFEDWMKLDLEYIDRWSILLDFEILLKTVPAIVKGTGQ